mmetsp:Transcript_112811/g.329669  ORF Transcript_112811/g.329669 Transcript_112811/m.329669 type:complete len:234 (-) Transcript_112811:2737-3438(-)
MPSFCTCVRSAATTACPASPATCFLAALREAVCFLHLASCAPSFTFSFTSELLASLYGPVCEVLISSMCSLILACAFSMAAIAASRPFCPSSMACRGFSRSAPLSAMSFSATGSAASTAVKLAVIRVSTSAIMAVAALRSATSWRFFLSVSIRAFILWSKSATLFFICEWAYWTLLTRGLILASSAFVSASGPTRTAFSSSVFCSRYLAASLAASASSFSDFSIFFCSAAFGE